MIAYTRSMIALFAVALLAACGGGGSSTLEASQSKHVAQCEGFTPGFWCGGASTATDSQCMQVGGGDWTSCADMCQCFVGRNSANAGVDSNSAGTTECSAPCAAGDVLQKFWAALQLSNPELLIGFEGIACNYPDGTPVCNSLTVLNEPYCTGNEIQALFESTACEADRAKQLTIAGCIDTILNFGGFCVLD